MQKQPRSVNGLVDQLKSVTKQHANGRWTGQCIVALRVGISTESVILDAPGEFGDELSAVLASFREGMKWVEEEFPQEP